MPPKLPIKLFAGPSLNNRIKQLAEEKQIEIFPPVRRFDIPAILENGFRGVLAIADGFFYQDMSVGHVEIRTAIEKGCTVYGLSSMGAIRAFEMRSFGMIGYGKVYEWFFSDDDFQDDEVALMHGEAPEYLKISEPLVHFRECLKQLNVAGKINAVQGEKIIKDLKFRFFGERTMPLFKKLIQQYTDLDGAELVADFDKYRIKTLDLERFIKDKVWENTHKI